MAVQAASILAHNQIDWAAHRALTEENLTIALALGDGNAIADARGFMAMELARAGDHLNAEHLMQQCLTHYQKTGNRKRTAWVLNDLCDLACRRGDNTEARMLAEEALAIAREIQDLHG